MEAPQIQICKVPTMPFRMSAVCSCGGEYHLDDSPVAFHPRTFKHKCNKCGYELLLSEAFPKTVYEELTLNNEER